NVPSSGPATSANNRRPSAACTSSFRRSIPPSLSAAHGGRTPPTNALWVGMRQEMRSHDALGLVVGRQHGLVTSWQLQGLGFSGGAVKRMAKAGRLHRLHRGVYALGNPTISTHGSCLAAVLACGRDAVLSHESAAWLWGLQPSLPRTPHVTV